MWPYGLTEIGQNPKSFLSRSPIIPSPVRVSQVSGHVWPCHWNFSFSYFRKRSVISISRAPASVSVTHYSLNEIIVRSNPILVSVVDRHGISWCVEKN